MYSEERMGVSRLFCQLASSETQCSAVALFTGSNGLLLRHQSKKIELMMSTR